MQLRVNHYKLCYHIEMNHFLHVFFFFYLCSIFFSSTWLVLLKNNKVVGLADGCVKYHTHSFRNLCSHSLLQLGCRCRPQEHVLFNISPSCFDDSLNTWHFRTGAAVKGLESCAEDLCTFDACAHPFCLFKIKKNYLVHLTFLCSII